MRFILAVSVWVICSSIGFKKSLSIKKRSYMLGKVSLMLDCFKNEIEYGAVPVMSLVEKYSLDGGQFDLITICNEKLKAGIDFPLAWKASVEEGGSLLEGEEKSRLLLLGELLGTSDAKSQCEMIKTQQVYFCERARQAREKTEKCFSSFICTGVFAGFAFFVFIV